MGLEVILVKSLTVGTEGYGQWAIRGADVEPEDEGNMGIAFKWYAENLNDTEFGFYFAKYTSRLPAISAFQGSFKTLQELVARYRALQNLHYLVM